MADSSNLVAVNSAKGSAQDPEKARALLDTTLEQAGFWQCLLQRYESWQKEHPQLGRSDFKVLIIPNFMVYVGQPGWERIVTNPDLVRHLVARLREQGFEHVSVGAAENSAKQMSAQFTVETVARHVFGQDTNFELCDLGDSGDAEPVELLTAETTLVLLTLAELTKRQQTNPRVYGRARVLQRYTEHGEQRVQVAVPLLWRHRVSRSFREADFRISFAKLKSHNNDYFTLTLKNIFGCLPEWNKTQKYHQQREWSDVCAALNYTYPCHFAIIDGIQATDGWDGYKQAHPIDPEVILAGRDPLSVDAHCYTMGGVDWRASRLLSKLNQAFNEGNDPRFQLVGNAADQSLDALVAPRRWDCITPKQVWGNDTAEEFLLATALFSAPMYDQVNWKIFRLTWFKGIVMPVLAGILKRLAPDDPTEFDFHRERLEDPAYTDLTDRRRKTIVVLVTTVLALALYTHLFAPVAGSSAWLPNLLARALSSTGDAAQPLGVGLSAHVLGGLIAGVALPWLAIWLFIKDHRVFRYGLGWGRPKPGLLLVGLATGLVAVAGVAAWCFSWIGPHDVGWGTWDYLWLGLLFQALGVVCTEFLLRGFLLFSLAQRLGYGAIWVVLLPTVMLYPQAGWAGAVVALVGGAVLGFVALRAKSVWYGAIAHFLFVAMADVVFLLQ